MNLQQLFCGINIFHVNLSIQTVFMLMMMMMNRGYRVQQSAPTYDVVNRTSNDKLTAKCKMSLFFPPAYIKIYLVVTGTRYTLLIYYTPEVYKHDLIKVSALLNRINKDWRFHSITAVSEKKRRRKVYILVAFGETFPTIYNIPTCDHPMGSRWYSTVLPIYFVILDINGPCGVVVLGHYC